MAGSGPSPCFPSWLHRCCMAFSGASLTLIISFILQSAVLFVAALAVGCLLGLLAHERSDETSPAKRAFWRRCGVAALVVSVLNATVLLGFAFIMTFRAGSVLTGKVHVRPLRTVLKMLDTEFETGDAARARAALRRAAEGVKQGEPGEETESAVYDLLRNVQRSDPPVEADATSPGE